MNGGAEARRSRRLGRVGDLRARVEIGWVSAHAAIYPLGLLRDRGDDPDPARFRFGDLPLAQRGLIGADVEAATTPIVLVHGIVDNRTIFTMMRRGLRRRGFGCIRSFSYGPHTNDLRATAERFGEFVEDICEETGSDRSTSSATPSVG